MLRMKISAATPALTPSDTGRLKHWDRGVPAHGEFAMFRSQPSDGSAPLEFASRAGTALWMSPDDDLSRVMSEATSAAAQAGQAVAIFSAEPGHWQQLFVAPLFQTNAAAGAAQALAGVGELDVASITRGTHLLAVADATQAIDLRAAPVDATLLPPRARPGA